MCFENLLLASQDVVRLIFAPDHRKRLGLAQASITARQEHASFLDRQLPLDARQATLEQVVNLCPEPPGDDPQHPSRRLAASELDLVQERAAEVRAADAGEAKTALLAHTADPLPERFVPGHCKAVLYR